MRRFLIYLSSLLAISINHRNTTRCQTKYKHWHIQRDTDTQHTTQQYVWRPTYNNTQPSVYISHTYSANAYKLQYHTAHSRRCHTATMVRCIKRCVCMTLSLSLVFSLLLVWSFIVSLSPSLPFCQFRTYIQNDMYSSILCHFNTDAQHDNTHAHIQIICNKVRFVRSSK